MWWVSSVLGCDCGWLLFLALWLVVEVFVGDVVSDVIA